jgi:hypothetical protein
MAGALGLKRRIALLATRSSGMIVLAIYLIVLPDRRSDWQARWHSLCHCPSRRCWRSSPAH